MADMSSWLSTALINYLFRAGSAFNPSNLWIALCTTTPVYTDDGTIIAVSGSGATGVEVSGGSYARQQYNGTTSNWAAASGNPLSTQNSNAINFPTATANWGTIVGMAICTNNFITLANTSVTSGNAVVTVSSNTGLVVGDPVYLKSGANTLHTTISNISGTSITLAAAPTWTDSVTTFNDGGNMVLFGALNASLTVNSGASFSFTASNLQANWQ